MAFSVEEIKEVPLAWVRDPDSGGVKIPEGVKGRTKERILQHAEDHFAGKYTRLDVRFRGQFCYVDAFTEPSVANGCPNRAFRL